MFVYLLCLYVCEHPAKMCEISVPVEGAHIFSAPSTEDLWEGDSLTLKCNLSKGTYVKMYWYLDNRIVQPHHVRSYNTLEIHQLSTSDSGKYTCVASNQFNDSFLYNSTDETKVHVKGIVGFVFHICTVQ